jgi:hypothetical protein
MYERRAFRLILEVAFLAALAGALAFADLEQYKTIGVMLLGWVIVAVFEWGALRTRPHYGSGLPPRWYVPQITLPPPRPLEQFSPGYPTAEATGDAPTWIASPAMLAEWPVADTEPGVEAPLDEHTHVHDVLEVERAVAVADEAAESAPPELDDETDVREEAEPEAELQPEPEPRSQPRSDPVATAAVTAGAPAAHHRIDPLEPPPKSKRFGRRPAQVTHDALVREGPSPARFLPLQARDED